MRAPRSMSLLGLPRPCSSSRRHGSRARAMCTATVTLHRPPPQLLRPLCLCHSRIVVVAIRPNPHASQVVPVAWNARDGRGSRAAEERCTRSNSPLSSTSAGGPSLIIFRQDGFGYHIERSASLSRRRERCHEGSRWRPSPGSLAQPTTLRDRRPIVIHVSPPCTILV